MIYSIPKKGKQSKSPKSCIISRIKNMQKADKRSSVDRLNYSGSLKPVIDDACAAYNIGTRRAFSIIPVGYEDCNIVVETEKGKYLAKIFQKARTPQDIYRYRTIMEKTIEAGVNHPPLLQTQEDGSLFSDPEANGLTLVVMKFIEGKTFLELDRAPEEEELRRVLEQAARVNRINHHPTYLSDSWAVPNIREMFERTRKFIEPRDLKRVEQVIAIYNSIPVKRLPHRFVHGDLTKANILKSDDGNIYVLDFSCANWYPRIQELAVIAANLLYDGEASLRERTELVIREYRRFNQLTIEERKHLYNYALAAAAMEFMGSHQEKYINGNDTTETDYWMNLGREGLRRELG